jgi:hypothetical protein
MRRSYWLLAIALLSALGLGALARPAQAAPAHADIPAEPGMPIALRTDGSYVAWTQEIMPTRFSRFANLYVAAPGDSQPTLIAGQLEFFQYIGGQHPSFDLDNGTLVWIDARFGQSPSLALLARDLHTGATKTVVDAHASFPAISGSKVAWWDIPGFYGGPENSPATLKIRDIGTMGQPATLAQVTLPHDYLLGGMRMSANWIIWRQGFLPNGENNPACWDLYAMPVSGGEPRRIDSLGCDPLYSFNDSELSGDTLAYTDGQRLLVVYNLSTGTKTWMSGPQLNEGNATDGRFVFWGKSDSSTVWGFDPASESAFPIDQQAFQGQSPAAHNGVVAWFGGTDTQHIVIRARSVAELLPSARVPAVAGRGYFPETGHTLGGAFRDYWNRNGGVPVFGYALTEEFTQRAPESAYGYTVQYFERQRFEYHPENAGTPYEVLLGRLGAEALAAQGRDWQTLPKADPAAPHYYAITGQAIAPEFWDYWRSHGLEFGDRGVSEREALALWGYPITPPALEQVPTGETLLVQWFERARFEYHPAKADPYKVLLGRLAADRVDAFGWK